MNTAPAPLRAATVAGAILAVIFIILSAVVGGINAWRSQSSSAYEAQAAKAQSDKAGVDEQITEAKARLDTASVRKDAKAWCDSINRDTASSIRDAIKTYDSATSAVKEAIHEECSAKETLANAQRTASDSDFTITMGECTTDETTTTVTGTFSVNASSSIASLGSLDVTIVGYTADKGASFNPSTPYQGTTTIAVTPGASMPFTVSVPYDPATSAHTECVATMHKWWPTNM